MARVLPILALLLCGIALAAPLTVQRAGDVITLRHQGEQLVLRRDMKFDRDSGAYSPIILSSGFTLIPPTEMATTEPGSEANILTVKRYGKTIATIDIDKQLEAWMKAGVDWGGKDENDRVRGKRELTGRMPALFNIVPVGDSALAVMNVVDVRMSEQSMLAQMLVRVRTASKPAIELVCPLSAYPFMQAYHPQPRLFRYYDQLFLYTGDELSDDTRPAVYLQQLNADGTPAQSASPCLRNTA